MNISSRWLAPRRQVKKKSPAGGRSEIELLQAYRKKLERLNIEPEKIEHLDLGNDFYWLFRLSGILAGAYHQFDRLNEKHFAGRYPRPVIRFCNRSTGGYYNKTRHEIGISFAMTVEHGEGEFNETLLHEIAHIVYQAHSAAFYELLVRIGGSGRKAPMTLLLAAKRVRYVERNYPVIVHCPNCKREHRYKTRRALRYACRPCCVKFAGGKYDSRFKFIV
ncbi:MAG: hypothetical protein Q8922_05325 [Bacteroidota bacterium]|nr:hypothetical protein [Bacteroidota bacterium]MDP4233176.1 hypothetical protein [Bacteroidota bacterium]MDP4241679.1 hypothetical protein [Bacteroidota bacterium]MDP4287337.1 hypothetical protein [Bacteroidota bacterium]